MMDLAARHAFSRPELIQVSPRLAALRFDLMKFTPALRILDDARLSGALPPGGAVYESSSGTFALALAIISAIRGYKLTLVTGPVSDVVRWRLEGLGATLQVVPASRGCEGGIQQARLHLLGELLAENESAFWPRQYTNPLNACSYEPLACELAGGNLKVDTLVGSVGSGGSLFGIGRVLRDRNPDLRIVAVDHNRSVIFGAQPERITRMDREAFEQILAMGAGIPMGNVDYEKCDEVHWIPIPKMLHEVRRFHAETGHLVGPSAGAALAVARYAAAREPSTRVLAILPDHGVRYVETIFDPGWLAQWGEDLDRDWADPLWVETPLRVTDGWCATRWGRRGFKEILGHAPRPREAGWNP